jgi:hypothetical protein
VETSPEATRRRSSSMGIRSDGTATGRASEDPPRWEVAKATAHGSQLEAVLDGWDKAREPRRRRPRGWLEHQRTP